MAIDLETLEQVLKTGRKHGLQQLTFKSEGDIIISATFGPATSAATSAPTSSEQKAAGAAEVEPDTCPCGHILGYEHSHAGCLMGCSIEKCTPRYTGS